MLLVRHYSPVFHLSISDTAHFYVISKPVQIDGKIIITNTAGLQVRPRYSGLIELEDTQPPTRDFSIIDVARVHDNSLSLHNYQPGDKDTIFQQEPDIDDL